MSDNKSSWILQSAMVFNLWCYFFFFGWWKKFSVTEICNWKREECFHIIFRYCVYSPLIVHQITLKKSNRQNMKDPYYFSAIVKIMLYQSITLWHFVKLNDKYLEGLYEVLLYWNPTSYIPYMESLVLPMVVKWLKQYVENNRVTNNTRSSLRKYC